MRRAFARDIHVLGTAVVVDVDTVSESHADRPEIGWSRKRRVIPRTTFQHDVSQLAQIRRTRHVRANPACFFRFCVPSRHRCLLSGLHRSQFNNARPIGTLDTCAVATGIANPEPAALITRQLSSRVCIRARRAVRRPKGVIQLGELHIGTNDLFNIGHRVRTIKTSRVPRGWYAECDEQEEGRTLQVFHKNCLTLNRLPKTSLISRVSLRFSEMPRKIMLVCCALGMTSRDRLRAEGEVSDFSGVKPRSGIGPPV